MKSKKWKDGWYIKDMQPGDRISLSENGWIDNKLCIEWLKDCFEPATKVKLRGEYRLLIVDGHASHISNDFIKFIKANKIICLCLPPHSTHLLQPLDVSEIDRWSKITKSCELKNLASRHTTLINSILFLLSSKLDDKAFRLEIFNRLGELLAWYPITQLLYFRNYQYALNIPLPLLQPIILLIRHYKLDILRVKYLHPSQWNWGAIVTFQKPNPWFTKAFYPS